MAETSGSKTLFMLIGAILFGIVAAGLSVLYLKSREQAFLASLQGADEELVEVVIAKDNLPQGLQVKLEYFDISQIPGKYATANTIRPEQFKAYLGRFVNVPLEAGKPLLASYLVEDFPIDFSDLVKQGRRAITITVDEVNSINGLIRPGNRIDVYVNIEVGVAGFEPPGEAQTDLPEILQKAAETAAAGTLPEGTAGELIKTAGIGEKAKPTDVILPVLGDLQVLATGREAYDETLDDLYYPQQRTTSRSFTTITVDVSPKQAALLAIAEDKGDLIAVLRNRKDRGGAMFSGITPFDLSSNAIEMERVASVREAAEAMGATLDANGNWVTKDGKIIRQDEMEKVAAMHKAAQAAGATIDANGNWVTADGKVIQKEDIAISETGTVTTKGGALLAATGISVNANGDYVDAGGNVIRKEDVIINPDGTVTSKDAIMAAAGYTRNANGDYVDAKGNVVKPDDIRVLANGTVMTADGKVLSGPGVTVNKDGFLIAEDGTVMTADGKVLSGVFVDENGNVVAPDGSIMTDSKLTVAADGTVRDSNGNTVAGVTASTLPPSFGETGFAGEDLGVAGIPKYIGYTVGGESEGGVAKTTTLPVVPLIQDFPPALEEKK